MKTSQTRFTLLCKSSVGDELTLRGPWPVTFETPSAFFVVVVHGAIAADAIPKPDPSVIAVDVGANASYLVSGFYNREGYK